MALKITVEKVANGTVRDGSHIIKTVLQVSDNLPITVVIPDGNLLVAEMKAFLDMAIKNKTRSNITAIGGTPNLVSVLALAHEEHITP